MNAAATLIRSLERPALLRLAGRGDAAVTDASALRAALARRYATSLPALLNRARRDELEQMAAATRQDARGKIGELRARLWQFGARLEEPSGIHLGTAVQPVPIVLGGKLVHLPAGDGLAPPARQFPRPVPPPRPSAPPTDEPDTLEELLARASALCGVSLGDRGADKGAHGSRIAQLLGVVEHGVSEPDWRGEVELKTVPVVRDPSGWWRVKEDPAVSMEHAAPRAKLERVLWIARVADGEDSTVLSWYYQEWSSHVARLVRRWLHTRPKGGAGATTRGWYLHKRYFIDCGFLRTLNG